MKNRNAATCGRAWVRAMIEDGRVREHVSLVYRVSVLPTSCLEACGRICVDTPDFHVLQAFDHLTMSARELEVLAMRLDYERTVAAQAAGEQKDERV
jgi:hypothetical protein